MKICFIDSGVGGLNIFESFVFQCKARGLDDIEAIYFADLLNSPYGARTAEDISRILIDNVDTLRKKFGCKFFVLACNTATACAIADLRATYSDCVFVGTEPNIRQAVKKGGNVLVMTTTATYFYSKYVRQYLSIPSIYFLPFSKLATAIDEACDDEEKLFAFMQNALAPFVDKNISSVVLGCTHYAFLRLAISKVIKNVAFFDSTAGVVKQIFALLEGQSRIKNDD